MFRRSPTITSRLERVSTEALPRPRHSPQQKKAAFPPGRRSRVDSGFWVLGKGGMGEVYRALDLTLNQPVALKFIAPDTHRDEAALARFRNEVRIAEAAALEGRPVYFNILGRP